MEKKYFIVTYGCQMNVHESEKLAGILQKRGYVEAANEDEADIIIFNTCCIRENAENHAYGNIGALKKRKKMRPDLLIAVGGCMTQQDGAAERLRKKLPFVDIVFGTHNLKDFGALLDRKAAQKKPLVSVQASEERPEEIVQFWERAGVDLDTMEFNSTVMERLGYESLIMVAALPDEAWLEYFSAREAVIEKLIKKYSENETIKAFAERAKYEVQLYSEYNYNDIDERYYGYVTYIGRKKIKCAL